MKLVKCKFEKNVFGLYLTPLIGFSNVHGQITTGRSWLIFRQSWAGMMILVLSQ